MYKNKYNFPPIDNKWVFKNIKYTVENKLDFDSLEYIKILIQVYRFYKISEDERGLNTKTSMKHFIPI